MNLYLRMLWLTLVHALRLRRRTSLRDAVETPFRVWPTDLDVLGHMNNGRYLTIMDLARVDLMMRASFWRTLRERGWYPVVAGQTITYRRSLLPLRRFVVRTEVLGTEGEWIYLRQTFLSGGRLSAEAVVRARFLKRSGGSVTVAEMYEAAGLPGRKLEVPAWVVRWTQDTRPPREA